MLIYNGVQKALPMGLSERLIVECVPFKGIFCTPIVLDCRGIFRMTGSGTILSATWKLVDIYAEIHRRRDSLLYVASLYVSTTALSAVIGVVLPS